MVMHARKPQRINDGYFEKHQTHPYQNSKYSGSKGNYDSRYNHERARDSPNSNSYRSDSPDLQSPRDRDRSYQSKSLYVQKIQKERENRDYKSRDKYSECNRSPKDRRSRDAEHRTNHDRSCSVEKVILHSVKPSSQNSSSREVLSRDISSRDLSSRDMSRDGSMRESLSRDSSSRDSVQRKPLQNSCQEKREPERPPRVGDWSEHISSSGKKYYYNCKTEVSQWEKPREWLERERARDKQLERSYSSGNNSTSSGGSSNANMGRPSHDKHSNSRPLNSNSREAITKVTPTASTSRQGEKRDAYWNSQSGGEGENHDRKKLLDGELQSQDMDISPGDSTPTSETSSYPPVSHPNESMVLLPGALPRLASHPPHQIAHAPPQTSVSMRVPYQQHMTLPGGKPLEQAEMNTQAALQTLQNALLLGRQGSGEPQVMPVDQTSPQLMQPLKVDTNDGAPIGEGPPTPTHSESLDCVDARKSHAAMLANFKEVASPPCSLSSLQSLTQASVASSLHALRPQGPHLTPSLANHYRDDLVNHVRGWPADVLEKQAQKLAEESHIMGSLHCTKVSADLKVARSIVRLTEIQATLQEQRILFLRQQIESLQQLKSHNAFMCDDS